MNFETNYNHTDLPDIREGAVVSLRIDAGHVYRVFVHITSIAGSCLRGDAQDIQDWHTGASILASEKMNLNIGDHLEFPRSAVFGCSSGANNA
jgi:putative component of toxin-antitoxin plasmid stabilization module